MCVLILVLFQVYSLSIIACVVACFYWRKKNVLRPIAVAHCPVFLCSLLDFGEGGRDLWILRLYSGLDTDLGGRLADDS